MDFVREEDFGETFFLFYSNQEQLAWIQVYLFIYYLLFIIYFYFLKRDI